MNTFVVVASMAGFILLAAVVFLFTNLFFGEDKTIDIDRLAKAIATIENWDGHSVGAAGERGKYQISLSVWSQHTNKTFVLAASNHPLAVAEQREVVIKHLEWIKGCLPGLKLKRSAFDIALVYTAGYGNVAAKRISPEKRDYANRVATIYYCSP